MSLYGLLTPSKSGIRFIAEFDSKLIAKSGYYIPVFDINSIPSLPYTVSYQITLTGINRTFTIDYSTYRNNLSGNVGTKLLERVNFALTGLSSTGRDDYIDRLIIQKNNFFNDLASTPNTGLVAQFTGINLFIPPLTGSVSPMGVSLKGLDGNNGTDIGPMLNKTCFDLHTNSNGGVVNLPPGIFRLDTVITGYSDVKIIGAGIYATEIRAASNITMYALDTPSQLNAYGWGLENLTLNGNNIASNGLLMRQVGVWVINRLRIIRCTDEHLWLDGGLVGSMYSCQFTDGNVGIKANKNGIYPPNLVSLYDCRFVSLTGHGVNVDGGAAWQLTNCDLEVLGTAGQNSTSAIRFVNAAAGNSEGPAITIRDCWFEGNAGFAALEVSGNHGQNTKVVWEGGLSQFAYNGPLNYGIYLASENGNTLRLDTKNVTFSNNSINSIKTSINTIWSSGANTICNDTVNVSGILIDYGSPAGLPNTVTSGVYTNPTLTVNSKGVIQSISNGVISSGGSGNGTWSSVSSILVNTSTIRTNTDLGKLILVKATGSNLNQTLPSALSCANGIIHFQITEDSNKMVSLSSIDKIDNSLSGIFIAGESAVCWSDGITWRKIAGKRVPFYLEINYPFASVGLLGMTLTGPGFTKMDVNTIVSDTYGIWDSGNKWVTIPRAGRYQFDLLFRVEDDYALTSVGIGMNTGLIDFPGFTWSNTWQGHNPNRNSMFNRRTINLSSNGGRYFPYYYIQETDASRTASMQLIMQEVIT